MSVGATYASWINGFFPGETNQAIIGAAADPDNDGIPNARGNGARRQSGHRHGRGLAADHRVGQYRPSVPRLDATTCCSPIAARDESVTATVASACEVDADLVGPWTLATAVVGNVIDVSDNFYSVTPGIDRVRVYVPRGVSPELFGRLNVNVP